MNQSNLIFNFSIKQLTLKTPTTLLAFMLSIFVLGEVKAQCNNLLTNGDAGSGLTGWSFSTGSGSAWSIQNNTYGPAFVASYNWTTMNQTIDLYALGYTAQYLDQQPLVSFYQMFRGHSPNYGDKYYYKIELKNTSNQVMDSYTLGSQSSPITTTSAWDTVSGDFTGYGTGLRYIRVECGGDDAEYWAGNYGTIIDNSVVSLEQILNVGICSGTYSFNNQTLSTTGTYTGSFTGQYGCDSNIVLNLHVGPYNMDDTFNLCEGDTFFYNGQPYTTSTSLSGSFTSAAGCDSNISYTVNFIELFDDTIWAGICPGEGYPFGNQTLFTAGTYTDQFTSQYGCDSNVVLVLSQNPAQFEGHTDYMCENSTYLFGDTTLTSPGSYFRIFQNSSGCDSIVNLTLKQDQSHDTNIAINLCPNDTLFYGSQVIIETGTYQESFVTVRGGCDSIVSLDVTAIEIDLGVEILETELVADENETGTTYQWLDCSQDMAPIIAATGRTYVPNGGGRFAVAINKNNCTDTSSCKTFWPLGMVDIDSPKVIVFPNPADEIINIQSSSDPIESIDIRDLTGRLVIRKSYKNQQRIELNISELSDGVYHIQLNAAGQRSELIFTKY